MRGGFRHRMMSGKKEEFDLRKLNREHIRFLGRYLRPHLVIIIFATFAMLTVTGTQLAAPYIIKVAIDDYVLAGDWSGLNWIALFLAGIYGIFWLASYFQTYLSRMVGRKVIGAIREDLYQHLHRLDIEFFHHRKIGDIMARVTHDVNAIQDIVTGGFINLLNDFFTLVGIIIIMFFLEARLALLCFIIIPLILAIIRFLGKYMRNAYREVQERLADLNADLEENIAGIRVVQALNREAANTENFNRLSWENVKANLRAVSIFALLFPTMNLSRVLGEALVLGYGGYQVATGAITLGVLMAFLNYVRRFFAPLADLSQVYNTYQAAGAALDRIYEYLNTEPKVKEPKKTLEPVEGFKGGIYFDRISFGYEDEPVIKDFSLEIKPGETVALVGATGAGKTTLVNLLARLYDVEQGKILIDGIDLRDISLEKIRKMVGVVPQQVYLFNTSIKENIRYGNLKATDQEIVQACRLTSAHDFISRLPQGYDTEVGEEGVRLSGGQKQLLSFSRALLADPEILILDEATSSVDTYTEHLIQKALGRLFENRTGLMIAHRFSTLKQADRICVLEKGELVAEGTHEELLNKSKIYADLYLRQTS